jgi:hypothetical protein
VKISSEENYAILAEQFGEGMSSLGASDQRRVFKRLHTTLDSNNPQYYIYKTLEGCTELEVIREGDSLRIYCRLVMGIPADNKHYNVLFVFFVDDHGYVSATLNRLDEAAKQWVEEITDFSTVPNVDSYLEQHDAKTAEYFDARLNR